MFLYRTGLLLSIAALALAGLVLATDLEDRIAGALCQTSGAAVQSAGDGACGFNADMQAMAILIAVCLLGLALTGIGILLRRREPPRRRMFGPRR